VSVGDDPLGGVDDDRRLAAGQFADLLVRHRVDTRQRRKNPRLGHLDELEAAGSTIGTHLTSVPCVAARLGLGAAANPDARPSGPRRASPGFVSCRRLLFGQSLHRPDGRRLMQLGEVAPFIDGAVALRGAESALGLLLSPMRRPL